MTGVILALNTLFAIVLWSLVARLLVTNWARGGAFVTLALVFLILLLAFDVIIAAIGTVLLLLFVPTLARSQLGPALLRGLIRLTDPILDPIMRATGGRIGRSAALVIGILFLLGLRIALLPLLRA